MITFIKPSIFTNHTPAAPGRFTADGPAVRPYRAYLMPTALGRFSGYSQAMRLRIAEI